MAVSGVGNSAATSTVPVVSADKVGFNGLTSETFLKLLIEQLKNQDPTEPMSNQELLQQISDMRALQSNLELDSTLKSFAANQQISAGAAFLGSKVTGPNDNQEVINGVVDRVFVDSGTTYLGIGSDRVKISDVTGVSLQ